MRCNLINICVDSRSFADNIVTKHVSRTCLLNESNRICETQYLMCMCYKFFIIWDTDMKNLALLFFLIVPIAANAGVYKWVDENGKVHYGDSPQVSQPTVEMNVEETAPEPSFSEDLLSREEKRERLLQSMEEDRLEKQEKRDIQKAENEKNRQKCNGTATGCVTMSGLTHYINWTRMGTGSICQTATAPAPRKAFVPKSINTADRKNSEQ